MSSVPLDEARLTLWAEKRTALFTRLRDTVEKKRRTATPATEHAYVADLVATVQRVVRHELPPATAAVYVTTRTLEQPSPATAGMGPLWGILGLAAFEVPGTQPQLAQLVGEISLLPDAVNTRDVPIPNGDVGRDGPVLLAPGDRFVTCGLRVWRDLPQWWWWYHEHMTGLDEIAPNRKLDPSEPDAAALARGHVNAARMSLALLDFQRAHPDAFPGVDLRQYGMAACSGALEHDFASEQSRRAVEAALLWLRHEGHALWALTGTQTVGRAGPRWEGQDASGLMTAARWAFWVERVKELTREEGAEEAWRSEAAEVARALSSGPGSVRL